VRLNLFLARFAGGSRREADGWIRDGRVTINGVPPRGFGDPIDPERDHIALNGRRVKLPASPRWYAYHKPPGVLVSRRGQGGKPTLYDHLAGRAAGLHPVGRLDFDSEGLLLLTDDGTLAEALLHPRSAILRQYRVWVTPEPDGTQVRMVAAGAEVEGEIVVPDRVVYEGAERGRGLLRIDLREGKKREIRILAKRAGLDVRRLVRIAFGPVRLGTMRRGSLRRLEHTEIAALRRDAIAPGARLSPRGSR
jgi:pseudouridine synthase